MSDIDSVPAAGRRPTVVTVSAYLLYLVAAFAVVLAVLPLPWASDVSAAAKKAYAGATNANQMASAATLGIYVGLVVDLIGAAILAVLAMFNLRGSNVTRILTWVLGGLGVLCCGGSTVLSRVASGANRTVNGVDMKAAQKQIAAAYPSWVTGVQVTLTVLVVIALILVIILLALPAAHPYFKRRPVEITEPPLPSLPYPPVRNDVIEQRDQPEQRDQ